jgi:hypothetical protein
MPTTDSLLEQLLHQPETERARAANALIASLGTPDTDVAPAWADEIAARVRAVIDGSAVLHDATDVFSELDRELAKLHG